MAISPPWSVVAEPREVEAAPSVDLSRPIPSWNTPEYPAEWPRDDEMSAIPRHGFILNYLMTVLTLLLRQRGRPFGINQDIGLHFVDANGVAQKCDPDLIVMPFPNTGNGSLRRWDMPCPPDCVFEVASPSTVQRDLGIKKEWYAWMEVREYWILDPVDSKDPALFKSGMLMPDGPLMGWQLMQGCYEPLEVLWNEQERSWTGRSPVLDCDIRFLQTLHQQHMDGGYRFVDLRTGTQLPSPVEANDQLTEEKARAAVRQAQLDEQQALLDEQQVQLGEQQVQLDEQQVQLNERASEILDMVAAMARFRYGASAADDLTLMVQRPGVPVPGADAVQAWMAAPTAEQFLDLVRRHCEVSGTNE